MVVNFDIEPALLKAAIEEIVAEPDAIDDELPSGMFTENEAARVRKAFEEYNWACQLLDEREEPRE